MPGFFSNLEREQQGRASGCAGSAGAPVALPCLYSNNSIEPGVLQVNKLTGGHKRSAFNLAWEIMQLAREFGLEHLGFLTLTFADNVQKLTVANKRFDSLNSNVLKARYRRGLVVPERQTSGRVHFHLLVVLAADIRSGADFEAFERGDYRSANACLRHEWAFWRITAPKYRFGRHELLPVKSNAEGIARYVGKYLSKHVGARLEADRGARLVRYLGYGVGDRKTSCRFGWNTDNAWLWRHKLAALAKQCRAKDTDDMKRMFGRRWAYHLYGMILAQRLDEVFPSEEAAMRSWQMEMSPVKVKCIQEREERVENGGKVYKLREG
jgi:hypothetical protein